MADEIVATVDNLNAINATINSGTLRVQFADRAVTYRSLDELFRIKSSIEQQLNANSGTTIRRQIRVFTSKGYGC